MSAQEYVEKWDIGMESLHKILLFDLRRRQEILVDEIQHLVEAIKYRLPLADQDHDSALSHLNRIAGAATELLTEVKADATERALFEKWWNGSSGSNHFSRKLTKRDIAAYQCFHQVWQSKMMIKASVFVQRLGELHDRLERQLERTNSDHPNPVLRRRAEQGQIDKFLCEHVKWIHRDLARIVVKLGAKYPYFEIPTTFYSWQYDASSSQHSFVSFKNYEANWKKWATTDDGSRMRPSKFTSIGLSYWMPERLVSHPIIGHELAHQVLQDLYGKDTPFGGLSTDDSQLSRTIRRLIHCAEAWLIHRNSPQNSSAQTWGLVREIICDLLSALRYGSAYLHAWIIEISEIDTLADFMHDSFGMLKEVRDFDGISVEYIQREILGPSRALARGRPPNVYYRGKVLIALLQGLGRETDDLCEELIQEVDCWLERHLELSQGVYAETDADDGSAFVEGHHFEREFARDLSLIVLEESERMSAKWAEVGDPRSQFLQKASQLWVTDSAGVPEDFCFARQVMSHPLRLTYLKEIETLRPDSYPSNYSRSQLRTFQDALWRLEWAIESNRDPELPERLEELRNRLRALNAFAIDDYLYRTGNPLRLLQALARQQNTSSGATETRQTLINFDGINASSSIDDAVLRRTYKPDWLETLDDAVRRRDGNSVVLELHNGPFNLNEDQLLRMEPLLLTLTEFNRLGLGQPNSVLHTMQLISLKPSAPSEPALISVKKKYLNPQIFELVLGRYDAFAINCMCSGPHESSNKSDNNISTTPVAEGFKAVSRLKRLVPVGEICDGKPIAAIMVSLRWDASRLMMAGWFHNYLLRSRPKHSSLFISDGWEDLVVVILRDTDTSMTDDVKKLTSMLDELNKSPLVASTETLFTSTVLDDITELQYRFVCVRSADGLSDSRCKILAALKSVPNATWELENISGIKDIQIVVKDVRQASLIYHALHNAANNNGGFRIETRVSWPDPRAGILAQP